MECVVLADIMIFYRIPEFTCMEYTLDEPRTDEAECRREVVSGRKVGGAFKSLVSGR